MSVVSIGNCLLGLHLCVRQRNSETKTGEKHNSISNNKR